MELKSVGIGIALALLVVGGIGAVAFGVSSMANDTSGENPGTVAPPTSNPVQAENVPEDVEKSKPAAGALLQEARDNNLKNARVYINPTGVIVLEYSTDAQNGPELKDELKEIALMYSSVIGNHTEAGGLTIHSGGVTVLVSKDSALAHSKGNLKDSAYFKTLEYKSTSNETDT